MRVKRTIASHNQGHVYGALMWSRESLSSQLIAGVACHVCPLVFAEHFLASSAAGGGCGGQGCRLKAERHSEPSVRLITRLSSVCFPIMAGGLSEL